MDLSSIISLAGILFATIGTIIAAVWKQGLWIATQFSELKDFVNSKVNGVLDKLEYHEKHDDERFAAIRNDIWMLRLDNAKDSTNQSRNVRGETTLKDPG